MCVVLYCHFRLYYLCICTSFSHYNLFSRFLKLFLTYSKNSTVWNNYYFDTNHLSFAFNKKASPSYANLSAPYWHFSLWCLLPHSPGLFSLDFWWWEEIKVLTFSCVHLIVLSLFTAHISLWFSYFCCWYLYCMDRLVARRFS